MRHSKYPRISFVWVCDQCGHIGAVGKYAVLQRAGTDPECSKDIRELTNIEADKMLLDYKKNESDGP